MKTRRLLRDAVMMRPAAPGHLKLAHAWLMGVHLETPAAVDQVYRMMDALDDELIAKMQEVVGRQSARLQSDQIGVLLADATTLYFEATQPDGLPQGYRLYPGITSDLSRLLPALADIRNSCQPLVVAADAGVDSKGNREGLLRAGYEYILAASMRKLPGALRNCYVQVANKSAELNLDRIAAGEKLDGLHGVWTSLRDASVAQARSHYSELHRIEDGFRVLKHDLATRPVFHWTERQVRAHVAICFAACGLLRTLNWHMRAVRHRGEPVSEGACSKPCAMSKVP